VPPFLRNCEAFSRASVGISIDVEPTGVPTQIDQSTRRLPHNLCVFQPSRSALEGAENSRTISDLADCKKPGHGDVWVWSESNNRAGVRKVVKRLEEMGCTPAVMEATGGYQNLLAAALRHAELPVQVVNQNSKAFRRPELLAGTAKQRNLPPTRQCNQASRTREYRLPRTNASSRLRVAPAGVWPIVTRC
jgi:hypothetical protein